jgi:hypothetical protein
MSTAGDTLTLLSPKKVSIEGRSQLDIGHWNDYPE